MDEGFQSLGTAGEVGHTVVDVEGLVNSMKEKLGSISESTPPPFHICRVPATILNEDNHVYYNPKIVSIGPFHRGKTNLQAMEERKWRYLKKFLGHCTREPALEECVNALKKCVKEMMKIEGKARECYSENIKPDDEFVKMMLLDGSFIIQLLLFQNEIEKNDPICRNIWMWPAIAADMLLLENQLPFCVLECLAKCIGCNADSLKKEALKFFSLYLPGTFSFEHDAKKGTIVLPVTSDGIHHLLHLVHQQSLKLAPRTTENPFCAKILSFLGCRANNEHGYERLQERLQEPLQEQVITIPTATELDEAGVVFKRIEEGGLLDVTFKNGVMRLPRLQITDVTNSLFRNIIAYEQCFYDSGGDFTSFCLFMDSLVSTKSDVQILKQSDIIENLLGSDEEVALLFNQLCKEIAGGLGQGSVGKACVAVDKYAKKKCNKWRARLMHDYFSNPWAVISLIAAVYALILASVSTYNAVF